MIAHNAAAHKAHKGNVVFRIIQKGQQGHGLHHKRVIGQPQAVFRNNGDILAYEPVGHQSGLVVAAHEYEHVSPGVRGVDILVQQGAQTLKHVFVQGFGIQGVHGFHMHQPAIERVLRGQLFRAIKGPHQPLGGLCADIWRCGRGQQGSHDLQGNFGPCQRAKDTVVVLHNLAAAAPVVGQVVSPKIWRKHGEAFVFKHAVKKFRLATAPAVDGLLYVTHPGERAPARQGFFQQGAQGVPLFAAGILKFVHQKMREARAHAAQGLWHAVFVFKHLPRLVRNKQAGQAALLLLVSAKGLNQHAGQQQHRGVPHRLPQHGGGFDQHTGGTGKGLVGLLHLVADHGLF